MGFFDNLLKIGGAAGGFLLGGPGGAVAGAGLGSALAGGGQASRDSQRARELQDEQIRSAKEAQAQAQQAWQSRSPIRDLFMQRIMGFQGQGNPFSQLFFGGGRPPMPGAGGSWGPLMSRVAEGAGVGGQQQPMPQMPGQGMPPPQPLPGFSPGGPQAQRLDPQNPLFNYTITPGAEGQTMGKLRTLLYGG